MEKTLVAPFPVIACGFGKIEFGDASWYGPGGEVLPALWIGNDGQGLGVERDRNEAAKDGETIAMITFANIKGLEALEFAVARVRANMEPTPAPITIDCEEDRLVLTEADALADLAGTPRPTRACQPAINLGEVNE